MEIKSYKNICCGVGPAGMGLIVNAFLNGKIDKLLSNGIALIDKSEELGPGAIRNYKISANSLGSVFIECLENLNTLQSLEHNTSLQNIIKQRDLSPPLEMVGQFQADLARYFLARLSSSQGADIYNRHAVCFLKIRSDETYEVGMQDLAFPEVPVKRIIGKNIFLNLGGYQNSDEIVTRDIIPGVNLLPFKSKVICSDSMIRMNQIELSELFLRFSHRSFPKTVILGGSHSAFSVALRISELRQALFDFTEEDQSIEIQILHRNRLRLYFTSQEEAQSASYDYDPVKDVCSLSGRINRFGGLRYDAHNFALQLMGAIPRSAKARHVELVSIEQGTEKREETLANSLSQADIIIPCFGYQPNIVPVYDLEDELVELATASDGGLATDEAARVYQKDGTVLKNVYSYGLGSGLRCSAKIGGEPSFHGRIDGIWMYQYDIGSIAVDAAIKP